MRNYIFLILGIQLITFSAWAKTITAQIDTIDIGTKGEFHLIKTTTGEVAFVDFENLQMLNKLQKSFRNEEWLEFRLDKSANLKSIQRISEPQDAFQPLTLRESVNDPYTPSVVTLTTASNMFKRMRRDYKLQGQCFNRAHIWTYDEYIKSNTNLNKVFLFFTSRYIRKYKYKWWFHVTPMTYVGGTKNSHMKILDRRYTKGPIRPKTWTDIFIKSKLTCPFITKYSQYQDNQKARDCYMQPVSMFYVVPSDLERLERTGEERIEYDELDVEHARWEAFK